MESVCEELIDFFPIINDAFCREIKSWCPTWPWTRWVSTLDDETCCTVEELVLSQIETRLRQRTVQRFWSHFRCHIDGDTSSDGDASSKSKHFHSFSTAVVELEEEYVIMLHFIEKLEAIRQEKKRIQRSTIREETNLKDFLVKTIQASLLSFAPSNYQIVVDDFYKLSFQVVNVGDKKPRKSLNDSCEKQTHCFGCEEFIDECVCPQTVEKFYNVNRILLQLEILERIAGEAVVSVIHNEIEYHILDTSKANYDVSFIEPFEKWLEDAVFPWLYCVYSSGIGNVGAERQLNAFRKKLEHFLYDTYTRIRIDQLFNIIIEFPDSSVALQDLKLGLERTDRRQCLISRLQTALCTRLLHAGVNTPEIITAYISSIRALKTLDQTGMLADTVTQPIRHYLRKREDTMKCVVRSLTEEGPGELAEELGQCDEDKNESAEDWEQWKPDPIDASTEGNSDIISMLVTVYGSKEMFLQVYRNLLADRLLRQQSYETEREIRYLELLKVRFGETQLNACEVMLKDVYDSKRINLHLHAEPNFGLEKQDFPCTCMILSAHCWPPFKEETLNLPKEFESNLSLFTKAFEMLKGNRTLKWKPHLGTVNLDIVFKERTLNYTVSPVHAVIIWHFQEKNQYTVDEMSELLMIPPSSLRRKISFWQTQGLLKEVSTDTFLLIEDPTLVSSTPRTSVGAEMLCDDEEGESIMTSPQDQREEELQVFWSYIEGMLTNLESLPPERIHQMLKMFACDGPASSECSITQLRQFLDKKVREHKLIFSGGSYKLPK